MTAIPKSQQFKPQPQPLPTSDLSQYKYNTSGLWTHPHTKFLQADYFTDNTLIQFDRVRVLAALPAIKNSILVHVYDDYSSNQFIHHVPKMGQSIKKLDIQICNFRVIGMLRYQYVFVVVRGEEKCEIIQWGLGGYGEMRVRCPMFVFQYFSYDQIKEGVFLFGEMGMLCCCWAATNQKNRVILAYYNIPFKPDQEEPCYMTQITLPSNIEEFWFKKLNNHSKVGWIPKMPAKQDIQVITHKISNNKEECIQILKISVQLSQISEDQSVLICDLWEASEEVIFVQLLVVEIDENYQIVGVNRQEDYIYRYGNKNRINFDIKQKHKVQILGQLRRIQGIPGFIQKSQELECPTYYIDLETEKVMAIEKPSKKDSENLYAYLDCTPQFQYCFFETIEPSRCMMTVRKMDWPKIQTNLVFAFLLVNLIDECDDDLISQAIRLIQGSQE